MALSVSTWLKKYRTFLFLLGTSLIALVVVAMTLPTIPNKSLGFDEGWNLQAPYELATEGLYASFGAIFEGQTKIFDPYLSTGPAVSLPIAALYKIVGIGVEQARFVMLTFYIITMFLLAWYLYMHTRSLFALLGPLTMLLVISSGGLNFHVEILGEIPAVGYGLASLIAWRRGIYWLAGIFAALATLSKFLMLLLVVAGCITLVLLLIRRWKKWKTIIIQALQWGLGVAIPFTIWELFRFMQLGGTFAAYKENIVEFIEVFKVTGSGVSASPTPGIALSHKLELMLDNIHIPDVLLAIAAIAILIGLLWGYRKLRGALTANLYGIVFIFLYAFWWFFISNGIFSRYTVPLVLFTIAITLHMFLFVQTTTPRYSRWISNGLKLLLLITIAAAVAMTYLPYHKPVDTGLSLTKQQEVANRVRTFNPQNLTHIGWWQNPEIQFLSGLHTHIDRERKPGDSFELLLSPILLEIVPADYKAYLAPCNKGIVFQDSDYILCKGVWP